MHKKNAVISVCVFLIFLTHSLQAGMINKHFHRQFSVNETTVLFLHHGDGTVNIIPWKKECIDIHVEYTLHSVFSGLGNIHDFSVDFETSETKISVIGKDQSDSSMDYLPLLEIECTYTIYAPAYLKLCLQGDDGDVYIKDWQASVTYTLDDEEAEFSRENGNETFKPTRLLISHGELKIDRLYGYLLVEGDNGSILLSSCQTPLCRVQLINGDIIIKKSQKSSFSTLQENTVFHRKVKVEKEYYFTTPEEFSNPAVIDLEFYKSDGDIRVELDGDVSAVLSVNPDQNSVGLKIVNPKLFSNSKHRISGQIFAGKGKIKIESRTETELL